MKLFFCILGICLVSSVQAVKVPRKRDACLKARECFNSMPTAESQPARGDMAATGRSTMYSGVQPMIGLLCGPLIEVIECLEPYVEGCPDSMKGVSGAIGLFDGHDKAGDADKMNGPDLKAVKAIMDQECPKFQKSFSTDECVKQKLRDPMFVQCVNNVSMTTRNEKSGSCVPYTKTKKCMEMYVGQCGENKANMMMTAASLFFDIPPACLEKTNGASSLAVSMATLLVAIVINAIKT